MSLEAVKKLLNSNHKLAPPQVKKSQKLILAITTNCSRRRPVLRRKKELESCLKTLCFSGMLLCYEELARMAEE